MIDRPNGDSRTEMSLLSSTELLNVINGHCYSASWHSNQLITFRVRKVTGQGHGRAEANKARRITWRFL